MQPLVLIKNCNSCVCVCWIIILSNKLDLNQETHFTIVILNVVKLNVVKLNVVKLNVVKLNVVMLSVITLSVIMPIFVLHKNVLFHANSIILR
jgi:hypothetical protein